MCGRYTLYQTEELADRFEFNEDEFDEVRADVRPRYNVAPEQVMPVVTEDENRDRHLMLMRWGFMPVWAKDERDVFKYRTFNARAEGLFDKVTWKRAARTSRCLVPSNGFYEWRDRPNGKQPYFIKPHQGELFAFAGIYRNWRDKDGAEYGTYAIVTTNANDQMSFVHNRMPVILKRNDEEHWLERDNDDPATLESLLVPYPDGQLDLRPVSRAVNTIRTDSEQLLTPVDSV